MGHEKSSFDWLPAGWKVQVRVRKSGKKDKCYVDPSNECKFYSKPDVLRYLKSVGINHPVCEETKNKSISHHSAIKFVVKEAVAEGLPAGWIKETRVTQKGSKIRRDSYYIDPASGHPFRSMKEVFRYLDTGKKGRRASKPKEQGAINLESRHDSLSDANRPNSYDSAELLRSSGETKEERAADSKAEKQFIVNQSLKSDTAAMNNANLPEANKLEQREKKGSPSESTYTVTEVPLENRETGNGLEVGKCKKRMLNDKGADLPRRTSKRLAGIEVNLSLEPHSRVRRCAGRQISAMEVNCANKGDNLANNSDEHAKRVRTKSEADKKQENHDLPPGDVTFPEEHAKEGIAEYKGDQKPEVPLDLSFTDLWKDPCIEFAIKTLTGAMPIGDENKVPMNQGPYSNLSDAVPGSCLDLPSKDIWSDPCFEFAVKMLTGEIDTMIDTILQQPSHNSSQVIEPNGLTLPCYRLSGCSNASVSFRHSNVGETSMSIHKQQL